jgi:hypothetical protein
VSSAFCSALGERRFHLEGPIMLDLLGQELITP